MSNGAYPSALAVLNFAALPTVFPTFARSAMCAGLVRIGMRTDMLWPGHTFHPLPLPSLPRCGAVNSELTEDPRARMKMNGTQGTRAPLGVQISENTKTFLRDSDSDDEY